MKDLTPDVESTYLDDQDNASMDSRMGVGLSLRQTPDGDEVDKSAGSSRAVVVSALHDASADTGPISGVRILPDEGIDLRAAVEEFESNLIRQALAKTGGNK